jgi:hypothetical protein
LLAVTCSAVEPLSRATPLNVILPAKLQSSIAKQLAGRRIDNRGSPVASPARSVVTSRAMAPVSTVSFPVRLAGAISTPRGDTSSSFQI